MSSRRLENILNKNFRKADVWLTLVYDKGKTTVTAEQAKKDVESYLKSLAQHAKGKLKYVYVTDLTGKPAHDVVINFKDIDIAREMWEQSEGKRFMANELGDSEYFDVLAKYITRHSDCINTSDNVKE